MAGITALTAVSQPDHSWCRLGSPTHRLCECQLSLPSELQSPRPNSEGNDHNYPAAWSGGRNELTWGCRRGVCSLNISYSYNDDSVYRHCHCIIITTIIITIIIIIIPMIFTAALSHSPVLDPGWGGQAFPPRRPSPDRVRGLQSFLHLLLIEGLSRPTHQHKHACIQWTVPGSPQVRRFTEKQDMTLDVKELTAG